MKRLKDGWNKQTVGLPKGWIEWKDWDGWAEGRMDQRMEWMRQINEMDGVVEGTDETDGQRRKDG